jgi:hypothetical protein
VRGGLAPALRSGGGEPGAAPATAGAWALLNISFTSPAFPCYADLRPIVLGDAGGAFFDQWALLRRETPAATASGSARLATAWQALAVRKSRAV